MLIPIITKLSVGAGAVSVTLADTTGAYNASTNPGGYGTPNPSTPPAKVGFTFRNWDDAAPYANLVTADSTFISELMSGAGHKILNTDLGITAFREGVQQIKYYSFEPFSGTYALVNGGSTITTTGFDPTTLNSNYIAALVLDGSGVIASKVLLLGDRTTWTSSTFTVTAPWTGSSVSGYGIMFATEADLKILIRDATQKCIGGKVGKLADMECCDRKIIDKLTDITMWFIAADIKMQCGDFDGAHSMILKAYTECNYCISGDCKTCN